PMAPTLMRMRVGNWMLAGMGKPEDTATAVAMAGPMLQSAIDLMAGRVGPQSASEELELRLRGSMQVMVEDLVDSGDEAVDVEIGSGAAGAIGAEEAVIELAPAGRGILQFGVGRDAVALEGSRSTTFVFGLTSSPDETHFVHAEILQPATPGEHPLSHAIWLSQQGSMSYPLLEVWQGSLTVLERDHREIRGHFHAFDSAGLIRCAHFRVPVQTSSEEAPSEDQGLIDAVTAGDLARVNELLAQGRSPDARSSKGRSAVSAAAYLGRLDVLDALLGAGADVNLADMWGMTPLMVAANLGHTELVARLVAAGAEPSRQQSRGMSALMYAVLGNHEQTAVALLEAGASPNGQDERGISALMTACDRGQLDLVKRMLKCGADPNLADGGGGTALLGAACSGNLALLEALLTAGARPDQADADGFTPLMSAASAGHPELVARLLKAGASPGARDQKGKTALDFARDPRTAEMLRGPR
ncbi:MAG: ankyrin repeat domain-containing protein, partial [Candidatus Eremiobacterota bacterium]